MPLASWEKLVPGLLAVLTVGLFVVLVVLGLFLGWSVVTLMDSLQAE
jgi:hypothetical protein